MKTMKALLGVLAVALFTTTAVADDESGQKDKQKSAMKFNKMDRDQDGRLSKEEAKTESTLSAQFAAVDQDSDGYVSESEYTAMARTDTSRGERTPSDYSREP
jgi:Ca2+-binding EF-hand superfamily protein